jgi:uncharacterized protein
MSAVPASAATKGPGGEPAADASALCLSCGFCCNGVLFSGVRTDPDEVARLRIAGLEVDLEGEKLRFRQPCPYHRDGRCGVYSDRFAKCRSFRCALLRRLEAGETTLGEAEAIVAQAKTLLARVTALDPDSAEFRVRARQRATALPDDKDADAPSRRRLLVESLALDLFFDRKFRNRKAVEIEPSRAKPNREEG